VDEVEEVLPLRPTVFRVVWASRLFGVGSDVVGALAGGGGGGGGEGAAHRSFVVLPGFAVRWKKDAYEPTYCYLVDQRVAALRGPPLQLRAEVVATADAFCSFWALRAWDEVSVRVRACV
jgi:hypothetical protein